MIFLSDTKQPLAIQPTARKAPGHRPDVPRATWLALPQQLTAKCVPEVLKEKRRLASGLWQRVQRHKRYDDTSELQCVLYHLLSGQWQSHRHDGDYRPWVQLALVLDLAPRWLTLLPEVNAALWRQVKDGRVAQFCLHHLAKHRLQCHPVWEQPELIQRCETELLSDLYSLEYHLYRVRLCLLQREQAFAIELQLPERVAIEQAIDALPLQIIPSMAMLQVLNYLNYQTHHTQCFWRSLACYDAVQLVLQMTAEQLRKSLPSGQLRIYLEQLHYYKPPQLLAWQQRCDQLLPFGLPLQEYLSSFAMVVELLSLFCDALYVRGRIGVA